MYKVSLIPGDGIGPEVVYATKRVIDASGVQIDWEEVEAGSRVIEREGTPLPESIIDTIRKNKVTLKGPITTPVGKGFRSVNVSLRQSLKLYANVRPIKSYEGIKSRYTGVDFVVVRENTEDLYAGIEYMVNENIAEGIKIISKEASENIVRFAFEYARKNNRKKVTAVHKANIMKLTDGLFLRVAREVSKEYKDIIFEDVIVDAMSMKLVLEPEKYDVLVTENLYGDILSDMGAGLVGGLGVVPGANYGLGGAIFEPAHGSAPDIAGKGLANPSATILSGVMMLRYLGENNKADNIEKALKICLQQGEKVTVDLGGSSSTDEFTTEVIRLMETK